jgi:hypothetical protein
MHGGAGTHIQSSRRPAVAEFGHCRCRCRCRRRRRASLFSQADPFLLIVSANPEAFLINQTQCNIPRAASQTRPRDQLLRSAKPPAMGTGAGGYQMLRRPMAVVVAAAVWLLAGPDQLELSSLPPQPPLPNRGILLT